MPGFLRSKSVLIATLLLVGEAAFYYARARSVEHVPLIRPLAEFPKLLDRWGMLQEAVVDPEVREVLQADEILNRFYGAPGQGFATNFFVAYFKSQRRGVRPHSPKNCMPGSGWEKESSGTLQIPITGSQPIEVNRYLVAKGRQKNIVIYWYQSHDRVVASEFAALGYSILDSARYNRSDTAIVRVVVPVVEGSEQASEKAAVEFIQAAFPLITKYFPA
ncbi:MAG: EpsI family protein [Bryobacteraceae bacterium]